MFKRILCWVVVGLAVGVPASAQTGFFCEPQCNYGSGHLVLVFTNGAEFLGTRDISCDSCASTLVYSWAAAGNVLGNSSDAIVGLVSVSGAACEKLFAMTRGGMLIAGGVAGLGGASTQSIFAQTGRPEEVVVGFGSGVGELFAVSASGGLFHGDPTSLSWTFAGLIPGVATTPIHPRSWGDLKASFH